MPRHRLAQSLSLAGTLIALCTLFVPGRAVAAVDLAELGAFEATPDQLLAAATEREAPEGEDGEVLLFEVSFTYGEDGTRVYRRHTVYRPLTQDGVDSWDEAAMNYSPWHQDRPTIRTRVVTPDGEVFTLDPSTISEINLQSQLEDVYQDRRQVQAPIPGIAVGTVLEEEIVVVDREPLFPAGTYRRQHLALGAPSRRVRMVLDAPEGMELRWATALVPDPDPEVTRADGRVRTVFELDDVAARDRRPAALPLDVAHYPWIAFTTGSSWNGVASAYSELVEERIADAAELASALPDDLDDPDDPDRANDGRMDRIRHRLAFLHDRVRYTGVELGDAAIVPRAPTQTLARGYGDCKDKATLLVALLREIGIPARVALLRANTPQDVAPDVPGVGLDGFNHAIVYVPPGEPPEPGQPGAEPEPELWIDATAAHTALGDLPPGDRGRWALVADPATEALIRTPLATAQNNRTVEIREVTLPEIGLGTVNLTTRWSGAPAVRMRWGLAQIGEENLEETLEPLFSDQLSVERLTRLDVRNVDALDQPFILELEAENCRFAAASLSDAAVALNEGEIFQDLPDLFKTPADDDREEDFRIEEPWVREHRTRIVKPPGFVLRELPENRTEELGPALYEEVFEQEGDDVVATFRFTLDAHRITAAEQRELAEGVREVAGREPLVLIFDQHGWQLLTSGRVAEAVAELRRLAELHPDEALHHIQLANAALQAGLVDESRRQGERAVELEPELPLAHTTLGLARIHGHDGRQFHPGFDRQGGIEAYRRAVELDPDDAETVANLALLLEFDEEGTRYAASDEDLDEAIELYRQIGDGLAGTARSLNLALALLWAGHPGEVIDLLDKNELSPSETTILTTAIAAKEGPEAAIRTAGRRSGGDAEQRFQVLLGTAATLLAQGHYDASAALYRVAGESAPNAAQLLRLAALIDRVEGSGCGSEEEGASAVGRALLEALLCGDDASSRLAELFHPSIHPEADGTTFDELTEALEFLARSTFAEFEAPERVEGRLALASYRARTTEVEDALTRVDLELGPPWSRFPIEAAVLDDAPGEIAAFELLPGSYARLALRLLDKNELEAAAWSLDRMAAHQEESLTEETLQDLDLFGRLWPPAESSLRTDRDTIEAAGTVGSLLFGDDALRERQRKLFDRLDEDDDRRAPVGLSLALGLTLAERSEEALDVLDRAGSTEETLIPRLAALFDLHRWDEILRVTDPETEWETEELDAAALLARAQALGWKGRLDEALDLFEEAIGRSGPFDPVYNNGAWYAAIAGQVDEQAIEWAERAAEISGYAQAATLHTLATVYAEAGRPREARQVLLQAIDSGQQGEVAPHDWYVLGRLAELYGFPEAAHELYLRVEPEDEEEREDPTSTWALARKRLAALEAPAEAGV